MSKMISVKVSPQAAGMVLTSLIEHVSDKMREPDLFEYQQNISDLIAELRTIQKLKIAYAHHAAECGCCDAC
jgi:predicted nucleotide-binding protein (sugar kinase/HSP70/actin superfamily)